MNASLAGLGSDDGAGELRFSDLIQREWIVTNGLGGYASSTLPGCNTRKYHGLLVAAMSPPTRRMVLLSRVEETVNNGKATWPLACSEYPGTIYPTGVRQLRAFSSDARPHWAYQADGWTLDKELCLLPGSNTVLLTYTLLAGDSPIKLTLRPLMALRGIHDLTFQWNGRLEARPFLPADGDPKAFANCYRVAPTSRTPELFFASDGAVENKAFWYLNTIYRREIERGYAGLEDLWSPGEINFTMKPGQRVSFVCSTEPIALKQCIAEAEQRVPCTPRSTRPVITVDSSDAPPAETLHWLQGAMEQFLPAVGANAPAIPATSYPWSPPNLRDALIAYAGMFLLTDHATEGRRFLEAVAATYHDGLIATRLTEAGGEPTYDGADTALWFVNAVFAHSRYVHRDVQSLEGLFQICARIVERYRAGGPLGIAVDSNGLIATKAAGTGTTWMDAKIADWVVTPRQGRPVELNALWYNALRIVAGWCATSRQSMRGEELAMLADRVKAQFNQQFWSEHAGCCFDVVGDHLPDGSIRANQLLSISLPFAVLDEGRHMALVETVRSRLLTRKGVRTLAPEDPAYQPRYAGDVVSRDRAYHQGSAYPWLLGPYVTALIRAQGRTPESLLAARAALSECIAIVSNGAPLGELFDGAAPQAAGGAIASARSVAEILRCYAEDVLGKLPSPPPAPRAKEGRPVEPVGKIAEKESRPL